MFELASLTLRRGVLLNMKIKYKKSLVKSFCLGLLLLSACSSNEEKTNYEKGIELYKKGDFSKAIDIIQIVAKEGDQEAQCLLGWMYWYGDGKDVIQNFEEAIKWYAKAAEQGHTQAQYHMGVSFERGVVVEQDYTQAVKWYSKAAKQNYADAQYNLGVMFFKGLGIEKNYDEAHNWFIKAAEQGYQKAQYSLGYMYLNGEGVGYDKNKAKKWLQLAADQGNENAIRILGDNF